MDSDPEYFGKELKWNNSQKRRIDLCKKLILPREENILQLCERIIVPKEYIENVKEVIDVNLHSKISGQ